MKRFFILCLALFLALSACTGNPKPSAALPDTPEVTFDRDISETEFQSGEDNIRYFTVSPEGEVYAVTDTVKLGKYQMDGTLVEDYGISNDLMCLYYYDGKVYAFDRGQNLVVAYDTTAKTFTNITEQTMEIYDLKNLVASDGYVYILCTPYEAVSNEEEHKHEDETIYVEGYIDFHEQLIQIRIGDGAVQTLDVPNTIAMYRGQNDVLYLYRCPGSYGLYSYDASNDTQRLVSDMSDVGYIHAFVYEQENFTFLKTGSVNDTPVANKRMSDGLITTLRQEIYTGPGSHVQYYAGNLMMRCREMFPMDIDISVKSAEELVAITEALRGELVSLYLGDVYAETPDNHTSGGTLTIYSWEGELNSSFRMSVAEKESGLRTKFIYPPLNDSLYPGTETFLLDLMSGDEKVDIYFLLSNLYCSAPMRDRGMYVPLNDSLAIGDFLDGCFDYIREAATAPNGDTWMLPLRSDTYALWYTPDNFARFNLAPEDLQDFDSFTATLERLHEADPNRQTFVNAYSCFAAWEWQYDAVYNNFAGGFVDYRTDLFSTLFAAVYEGWTSDMLWADIKDGYISGNPFYRANRNQRLYEYGELDPERVIFKTNTVSNQLSDPYNHVQRNRTDIMESWRVLPMPRLTEDCRPTNVWLNYAVINPFSKNKEAAITYLEAIARNPHSMTNAPVFLQKSIESYKGLYDTTLPCFTDVYGIFKDAGAVRFANRSYSETDVVQDYQAGRLTLDEAIAMLQREAEMWLGE